MQHRLDPKMRDLEQMVWDPDDHVFFAYGGYISSGGVNELYTFDPTTSTWSYIDGDETGGGRNGTGPSMSGQGQEITYDTKRKRMLTLIDNDGNGDFDQLWEYTTENGWASVCAGCTNTKRVFVYVPTMDATLVISGQPYDGSNRLDSTPKIGGTWMMQGDASTMTLLDEQPALSSVGVAYDPTRDVVVMYGGDGCGQNGGGYCSDTWELLPK
jgi:hypothetical protein